MRYILGLLFLYSCSQLPKEKPQAPIEEDLVSVGSALNQAQMSYLRGCVDAFQLLQVTKSFTTCRDKSLLHREEIKGILEHPLEELR